MSDFNAFKVAIQHQFNFMKKHKGFVSSAEKEDLWNTYLRSFPEGTNPIFIERTEHDCQCCKSFIRKIGGLVAIIDGQPVSLWDVKVGGFYQVVADALSALVKSKPIADVFLTSESSCGVDKNYAEKPDGLLLFHHFHLQMPKELMAPGPDIGSRLSEYRASKEVFLRSLTEISDQACETVLELIGQNSLYRGEEHKFVVHEFLGQKAKFNRLSTDQDRDLFCWSSVATVVPSVLRIRNTAIGTLLTDLSDGVDLDKAVGSFEAMVAPTNYKRPTALVTKAMVENAKKKIEELGLNNSLERRYATIDDISVNNILFIDRSVTKNAFGDVFDEIAGTLPGKQSLDRVEEVSIDKFVSDILPKAQSLEVLFENKHRNNLVSLVAPSDFTAKGLFKWGNPFSWSYTGELTDSIKERVKAAGGRVDADLRCSLSWFNFDDLDLHLVEPSGNKIFFGNKVSRATGGQLDVDMNAGSGSSRSPVENIFYGNKATMQEGKYLLLVNQFQRRELTNVGFEAEIEFGGSVTSFSYKDSINTGSNVTVAEFSYTHAGGVKFIKTLPPSTRSEVVWGVPTQAFHRVDVLMLSPNHWDSLAIGNKHYFFFIDKCRNDGVARGFFNEFLSSDLDQHRKVLEVVGSKMKTEESDRQLSGLGFSSTKRDSVVCKVTGSFTRTIKILF